MALSGNLRDFSLPDVFQLISFSHKTGTLAIERGDAKGFVYFQDGDVFFAISNWNREPMGRRLVRGGKITERQLQRALEIQGSDEGQRRLGQILVDEGFLSPKVLETFVQEQIQDTIFDLFRWEEGDFDFKAGVIPTEEDVGLSVSVENIIMEGSRRLEEWDRIRKKIPSDECVFRMATAPGEGTFEVSLKPSEWKLLCLLDGNRTLVELSRLLDLSDFQVARILYGMFSGGLLERVDTIGVEEVATEPEAEDRPADESALEQVETPQPVTVEAPQEVEASEPLAEEPAVESATEEVQAEESVPEQEVEEVSEEAEAAPEETEVEPAEAEAPETEIEAEEAPETQAPVEAEESFAADLESIIEAAESTGLEEPPEGVETAEPFEPEDVSTLIDEDEIDSGDLDLSDELEALTGSGGGKAKTGRAPKASAKTSAAPLRTDSRVSKDLLVKLIDGVKKL